MEPGESPIRVLLCDDHEIPRRAIAANLALEENIEVVAQAADGAEAVELTKKLLPDVVVMDLHMPVMGGLEATARIRAEQPGVKVLVLTMSDERSDVLGAMAEGVSGYIVKDDPAEEFVRAVRLVARGGSYVSPRPNLRRNDPKPWDSFTDRDREILRMVAEGRGDKEIGEAVYLAERTVKHRLGEMRRALGAENRTHLAVLAIKQKILRLPDD